MNHFYQLVDFQLTANNLANPSMAVNLKVCDLKLVINVFPAKGIYILLFKLPLDFSAKCIKAILVRILILW